MCPSLNLPASVPNPAPVAMGSAASNARLGKRIGPRPIMPFGSGIFAAPVR